MNRIEEAVQDAIVSTPEYIEIIEAIKNILLVGARAMDVELGEIEKRWERNNENS